MKIQNSKLLGFSLVELLVVISIVTVLSVSSIVGFGYLGDILKTKEVIGLLADTIKQEELKVLRGDFEKATIHFLEHYIVIEEEPEGKTLKLNLLKVDCGNGNYKIDYDDSGNLIQKDEDGAVMQIKNVTAGSECVTFNNPTEAVEEIEWSYQLTDADQFSSSIRFIHFNLQREDLNNPIVLSSEVDPGLSLPSGSESKVEVIAPYGKKRIYYNDIAVDSLDIIAADQNATSSDTLTIR